MNAQQHCQYMVITYSSKGVEKVSDQSHSSATPVGFIEYMIQYIMF